MPSPALTFGVMLATLLGALAHLILRGDGQRLLVLIFASWIGFAIGQALGHVMAISILTVGSVYVLTGSLGAIIALAATAILARHRGPRRLGGRRTK